MGHRTRRVDNIAKNKDKTKSASKIGLKLKHLPKAFGGHPYPQFCWNVADYSTVTDLARLRGLSTS
jgi:hypothetical protein